MEKKILYFITSEDATGINLALENQEDDISILLLQNAVYFATKQNSEISKALNQNRNVVACKDDVEIRGLKNLIFEKVNLINYEEIIDLVLTQDTIINM